MNYYERHIGDYIRDTVSLTMLEDGAYNRLMDQCYQTERPLPLDRKMVYRLARAISAPERKAVDFVIANFFELIEGVGYEQKRIRAEIERFQEKNGDAEDRRENERERQRRHRERRKQLFQALREHGEVPPYDTSTEELQAMLSRVTSRDKSPPVTQPVTRDVTANQAPDTRHQTPDKTSGELTASSAPESRAIPNPPRQPGDWLSHFRQKHGLQLDPSSVHDRKKVWPIFTGWCNAGLTLERVDAAVTQAQAQATETIAFLPGYVDRVIASQAAPKQTATATRDQERADVIATLTGRKQAHERTPDTLDVIARRVD